MQLQIIAKPTGQVRAVDADIQFMMCHPQFDKPAPGGMKIGFQR
uniref:Uncharacterized protein n=1 Tax=Curvibacter symbiont subsp. Hydra magnipapillata TaxID=667019 RepID=C9YAZ9_CURXX|nr:hypothetical protein Csp_A13000 [Curvibacter putative symbiont of Hydra magnipapillata]